MAQSFWIDPIDTLQTLYNEWYDANFPYDLGDINQDYAIDIFDIIHLVNGILQDNLNGMEYFLSNINEDDIINILDIIIIVNIILYS